VNFTLVCILTVLIHINVAGSRIDLSLFALSLGASPLTVGLLMSLLALLPMLFSVYVGRAIDRIGIRQPMLTGSACIMLGSVLAFLWPRLEMLFVTSCLVGSGFMLFHIAVNHAAAALGRAEDRARNFSLLALGFSTSGFIGPVLAGFAIDWIGHRHTFLLLSGFALISLIVLTIRKIEVPRSDFHDHDRSEYRVTDLLRDPALRRVLVVSAALSMAWELFTFVMPIHGSQLGLSASTIGIILGSFGSAIFCVRLVLPLIVHRVHEWKLLTGAMLMTGVALFALPFVVNVPLLIAMAFLLGIGLGGTQPMILALLYNKAPPGRGAEAVGVRTLLLNASQAGIPLLFGALGAALGMAPAFWAMALAMMGGSWYARKGW
jgi:predicted MFS family arabinose efflux permease